MTPIDESSDQPPEGSGGRLITISAEAAAKALQSLLDMAVGRAAIPRILFLATPMSPWNIKRATR